MKRLNVVYLAIAVLMLVSCSKEEGFQNDDQGALSGIWSGTMSANNWIGHFDFRMDLDQDGKEIEGTSTISFPDKSRGEATMILKGNLVGSTFTFEELSILEHTGEQESFGWCIKTGLLTFDNIGGIGTLTGSWSDPSQCRNTGEMNLSKIK